MGTKVMEIVVFGFRSTVHVSTMFRYASVNLAINHRCTTQYVLSMPQTQIYIRWTGKELGANPVRVFMSGDLGGRQSHAFPLKTIQMTELK